MSLASLRIFFMSTAIASALLAGCSDDASSSGTNGTGGNTSSSSSSSSGGEGGAGGGGDLVLDTPDKITTYLEGKTLTMGDMQIPSHPNGYDENVNFGNATQCYNQVAISIMAGTWNVTSDLGTLNNAPNPGDAGMCDHATKTTTAMFSSTAVKIENVTTACFDATVTFNGFSQEGRASFAADGKTLNLELYFGGQAAGHRCADGAVGAKTVKIMGSDFAGDGVQVYTVQ